MLSIKELSKSFSSSGAAPSAALQGLDLEVGAGELLCLLGPNGSGKTTLFKILSGVVIPDAGSVTLSGFDLLESPDESRRRTGFSPGEERSFYGRLTGLENLSFFAALRGIKDPFLASRLEFLEPALGLKDILQLPYQKTSAGMKQRLSLARAMLHDPELLLLDEPTKSLDPAAAAELRGLVRRVISSGRRLALWSTHNVLEAWEIGTRIALLEKGRLRVFGTPEELLDRSGETDPLAAYRRLAGGA